MILQIGQETGRNYCCKNAVYSNFSLFFSSFSKNRNPCCSLCYLGMNSLQFLSLKLDILMGISGRSSSGCCNVVESRIPPRDGNIARLQSIGFDLCCVTPESDEACFSHTSNACVRISD